MVDLKAQYRAIKHEVDGAIAGVIESCDFILGKEVEAFEREFAAYCGVESCVACGNGTDSISLALQAVGVGPGDEVITVSHTFIATAEAVTAIGAKPIFVDICPDTLLMDVSKVADAITSRTRAILPVHLYGQMVDMDPLLAIAHRYNLKVVEDAAQAHGATYKGRRAGSIGHAASFSFYPGKNLGAYGDAGAVVTPDANVARWIAKARNHGRATKYEHDFEARNSRMDGIQGAVLRAKLRRLDDWNQARRLIAARYDELLEGLPEVRRVNTRPDGQPVFHLYVVRHPARDEMLGRLREDAIEGGVHYPVPLHLQRAYAHHGLGVGSLPVTERAAAEVLSLPIFPELELRDCERVVAVLQGR